MCQGEFMNRSFSIVTKLIFIVAISFISAFGAYATGPVQSAQTVIPLEGLDPVMLAQGKEVQGLEKLFVIRGRFQYLFASAETKAMFEKDPRRYEIQMEGSCARMGPSTGGNPDLFTVYKERIYVFGSADCKKKFEAAPENYLEPDAGSSPKVAATPEGIRKGQLLIEKAVESIGGASRLDGLISYQEKFTTTQKSPQGDFEIKATKTIIFPDRARLERIMRFGTLVEVLVPGDSFTVFPGGLRTMTAMQRADQDKQARRNQVAILRARKGSGFHATAIGSGKVGETAVEQVAVDLDGLKMTVGIEPSTGRILSLSYHERGAGGAFGDIVKTFSDFRTVEGLTLPFKTTTTFNGEPAQDLSPAVESLIINGKVDPAIFEKPKAISEQ
jgi:YHS domain-containing protein